MPDLTLEKLAARLDAIEKQLADDHQSGSLHSKDWRRVAGMFTGNDFQKQIDSEGATIRQADPCDDSEPLTL